MKIFFRKIVHSRKVAPKREGFITVRLINKRSIMTLLIMCFFLTFIGCVTGTDFHVKDLVKSDINQVGEIHMSQSMDLMKSLTEKLYKKNPKELAKSQGQTIESRIDEIFSCPEGHPPKELSSKRSTEAILLGFEPEYQGDRVFAMMYGLHTMIRSSYNGKCELFMLDYLNAQNLYNSARNVEVLIWRLKTRKKSNGDLYILTNSIDAGMVNLSYERLFGKLISIQDTMAVIESKRTGRFIREAVHFAGMAFLPIGI